MRVTLAWGCGVGSLLALDVLARDGHEVTLAHVPAPADQARAVPRDLVEAQAAALRSPIRVSGGGAGQGSGRDPARETAPISAAPVDERAALASILDGADAVAFGYLRGEEYVGMFKLARSLAGVAPLLPVRHVRPDEAARQLAREGHRLFVRSVLDPMPREMLGRFLDGAVVDEIEGAEGRGGWALAHAFAVDGPRFRARVDVAAGDAVRAANGWRLDLSLRAC